LLYKKQYRCPDYLKKLLLNSALVHQTTTPDKQTQAVEHFLPELLTDKSFEGNRP
jgi:hypothetical protein